METLQEVGNGVAAEEQKIPMFKMVKDGHGFDVRVANLEHPIWAANTGIVKVEAVNINKRGARNYIIKNSQDKETGALFGIVLGVDRVTKDFIWEKITLTEMEFFDLSKKKERERFIVLSRHHSFEGSPNQFGKPMYRIIDQEKKANNYLEERSERKRSQEIADNLTYEQMIELAPAFGIRPESHSQTMLTSEILKIADNDHKKFLAVWDNPDRKGMTTFKRALKNGLINFDPINGFTYEGHQLGRTEANAFKYLTSNIQLLTTLDMISKDKEKISIHNYSPAVPAKADPITELEKALAAKEKELEELRNKMATTPVFDPIGDLKDEAKRLGIKGFALMGEDKLKAEIEKAKKQ